MGGDRIFGVPCVHLELDGQTLHTANFEPVDAPQQFGRFAGEHGAHDELDATSLAHLRQLVEVLAVLVDDALRFTLEDHRGLLEYLCLHRVLALGRLYNILLMAIVGGHLNAAKRAVHL